VFRTRFHLPDREWRKLEDKPRTPTSRIDNAWCRTAPAAAHDAVRDNDGVWLAGTGCVKQLILATGPNARAS